MRPILYESGAFWAPRWLRDSAGFAVTWNRLTALAVVSLVSSGCSVRSLAINALADSLATSGDVYAADDDPELIRAATPFALKTIESLLAEEPEHRQLLLAACRGFTQYAYAFVQIDAERMEASDFESAEASFERSLALYLRGRDYCLRSLELESRGITERLQLTPEAAVNELSLDDVPLLYWTGASWGAAIAVGQDQPELVADLPAVRALLERALTLDEDFDLGAIHVALIALESLPEGMGGSPERAQQHFLRAVELSGGQSAVPYVSLAEGLTVAQQDWREFERLLQTALEIDPDAQPSIRLINVISQERARWLLDRIDELFIDYGFEADGPTRG